MTIAPDKAFTLKDRYEALEGEILVTGIQALARAPIDQMRADRAAGHKTAAFISGYQGSPLGGYDRELLLNQALLDEYGIVLRPGINEELAATSVVGSQLVSTRPNAKVEGVAGYWYGKAPGLERAGDAIRHGLFAGTAPLGGVLALIGDDPACKSSTVPSRSDAVVGAFGFPFLDPGTMQDVLDLSRHGIEMSRACGLWVGLKVVTAVADGTGHANVDPSRLNPIIPQLERDGTLLHIALSVARARRRKNHRRIRRPVRLALQMLDLHGTYSRQGLEGCRRSTGRAVHDSLLDWSVQSRVAGFVRLRFYRSGTTGSWQRVGHRSYQTDALRRSALQVAGSTG